MEREPEAVKSFRWRIRIVRGESFVRFPLFWASFDMVWRQLEQCYSTASGSSEVWNPLGRYFNCYFQATFLPASQPA